MGQCGPCQGSDGPDMGTSWMWVKRGERLKDHFWHTSLGGQGELSCLS